MIIGCLTGNGKRAPIEGSYAYHLPGLLDPLAPDLQPEAEQGIGPFSFAEGALTDGDPATGVGWTAASVGETGVDLVFRLGLRCFVDRVILHQALAEPVASERTLAAPLGADGIEAVGHREAEGLTRLEVYASSPGAGGLALVGCTGQRGPATLPAGPVVVSVGVEATELVVRLISFRGNIRLSGAELWGAGPGEPAVFPIPAKMERLPGSPFVLTACSAICIGAEASEDTRFAATLLADKLRETYGWTIPVVQEEGQCLPTGAILMGKPGESTHLASADLPAPQGAEGFTLSVQEQRVALLAADRRGLVYGVECLLQLLAAGDPAPAAVPCLIEDAPRLPFRGVHLFLPARDQIDYTKRLIRYLLVPMRLNTIFLELAGGMRFDRRPEISEAWERNSRLAAEGIAPSVPHGGVSGGGWLTKAEVKELVDYARSYGLEVIPEIQSLSHVQYLTMTYPEIAEKPLDGGYPDSYCPLHPLSRRIVFDMIDEVVELLGPLRYIHMGHDEVNTMAECPRCRGKTRDELFALDVVAIHDYLKAKGVGMMIWADMLQPWQRYATQDGAKLIPKDIIMLEFVWYFRPWADTEDILLENGFQVIFGNCYSSHFTRYERRTSKAGVIGAEVSVWSNTDEETMGRLGKLYDLVYSANTSWSATCQEALRWTFDRQIAGMLPTIRARLRGEAARLRREVAPPSAGARACHPIDLRPYFNAPRRDPIGARGGYDLSTLPTGDVTLRGLPFHLHDGVILVENGRVRESAYPEQVSVPIGRRATALVFAHTCTTMAPIPEPFGARPTIARYRIQYADGAVESVDVDYGHHLAEWNRRHGAPLGHTHHRHAGYVATYPVDPLWQGKTAGGEDVTLYGLEWVNPRPEVEVRSVEIAAVEAGTAASLIVAGITLVTEAG